VLNALTSGAVSIVFSVGLSVGGTVVLAGVRGQDPVAAVRSLGQLARHPGRITG
jgi:hypothetical protein